MNLKSFVKKIPFARSLWYKTKNITFCLKHPFFLIKLNKGKKGSILQMVAVLNKKDAIGNSTYELSEYLQQSKIQNYILYLGAYTQFKNALPVKCYKFKQHDILLYHIGSGSKMSDIYLKAKVKNKILIYHNITPEKYFFDNREMQKIIKKGRKELLLLKDCTNLAICVSEYNSNELKRIGYKNVCVLGIPTRVKELLKFRAKIDKHDLNFITVGRIARHKCVHDVIKLFSEINKIDNNAKLNIVGGCDNKKYFKELKKLIKKLNLINNVNFIKGASEERLANLYSISNAYLCMSEHEGLCVPLIESMAFEIPIFAYSSSAIPETLKESGVLFKDKNDFKTMADVIIKTLNNKNKIKKIISKQNKRFKDFDNDKILYNYLARINDYLKYKN